MRPRGEARAAVALPRARMIEEKATIVLIQVGDAWCPYFEDSWDSYIPVDALYRADHYQGPPVNCGCGSREPYKLEGTCRAGAPGVYQP